MLLAYTTSLSHDHITPELVIIPASVGTYSPPVAVRSLVESSHAVFFISAKEAVVVEITDTGLIITPVLPANFFLTPDTTERPGVQAGRVLIETAEDGKTVIQYSRERNGKWIPWNPIAEQRQ